MRYLQTILYGGLLFALLGFSDRTQPALETEEWGITFTDFQYMKAFSRATIGLRSKQMRRDRGNIGYRRATGMGGRH